VSRLGSIRRTVTLERLLPLAIILGALVLIGSEFTDTFRIQAAGDTVVDTLEASERHSWAILVLGLCTIAAVTIAVVTGSKPAATATAVFGVAALLLFLLVDLPDAGSVGQVKDPEFVAAETEPEGGFWLLLIGSLTVAGCGIALATLSPEQLRALRPGAPPAKRGRDSGKPDAESLSKRKAPSRREKRERPTPPWSRRRAAAAAGDNGSDDGGDDVSDEPEPEPETEAEAERKPRRRRVRPKA